MLLAEPHKRVYNEVCGKVAVRLYDERAVHSCCVQPVPHIRAGFDEAVNSASQTVIDTVSAEIDKLGE